jgi:hypothetical protein
LASYRALAGIEVVAERTVIDVSGNGVANAGRAVSHVRDLLVEHGVTINGLPIGTLSSPVVRFYDECVVGGWGAFRLQTNDLADFKDAMLYKMRLEFAWRPAGGRIARVMVGPGDLRFAGSAPPCDSSGWNYGNVAPPVGH